MLTETPGTRRQMIVGEDFSSGMVTAALRRYFEGMSRDEEAERAREAVEREIRLRERNLDAYICHLQVGGFRPKKVVREVVDSIGVAHRKVTVYFRRIGGLPGPIPAGADFRPYPA